MKNLKNKFTELAGNKMPKFVSSYFVNQSSNHKYAHLLHKHPNTLELMYIYSGEGRYIVGKREYAVKTGDMVVCNAGILHGEAPFQEDNIQTYCCALTNVSIPGLPDNWLIDISHKPVLCLETYVESVAQMMSTLHTLYLKKDINEIACQHLSISILLLIYGVLEEQKGKSKELEEQKKENLVRKVTEYIDQHYMESLTLQTISQAFCISISNLSHIFKKETGLSPIQYVIHRRIGEAQSLLIDTQMPIHEIEQSLGFGSSCHFSAMFKKYVGISPKEYRSHFR